VTGCRATNDVEGELCDVSRFIQKTLPYKFSITYIHPRNRTTMVSVDMKSDDGIGIQGTHMVGDLVAFLVALRG
jgi:hypothetical protein